MRLRDAAAATGLAVIAVSSGAGQGAAFTPTIVPELGIYAVELDHAETVALHNSPLPGMLNQVWRDYGSALMIRAETPETDGAVYEADLSDVVADAAESVDGVVGFVITPADPQYDPPTAIRLLALGTEGHTTCCRIVGQSAIQQPEQHL
ncbi:hypothetical protein [Nocardia transvalensis]|uniref:hypothetical protein n=1 Tax=Nocardia transvalensis TaxID=37333 RepID=UPI00189538CC|nr:hypothetical protein [Nocardia transvalensis]MBF6332796.1 hypothetical protein [Nocardia transvalensis]